MSDERYFSDQAGIHVIHGLTREFIHPNIRNAVETWLDRRELAFAASLWVFVIQERDLETKHIAYGQFAREENARALSEYVRRSTWHQFLDLCSATYYFCMESDDSFSSIADAYDFRELLNSRFLRYHTSYTMAEDGRVVEPAAAAADEVIGSARALLVEREFEGPDRQFQAAIQEMSRRPTANYELVVAQATNAVEGVARIVLGEQSITLGRAIDRIADEHHLHASLRKTLDGLYGYASDAGGRHGLVGKPDADRAIASFCLHQSAAAIVLLADLYGRATVRA